MRGKKALLATAVPLVAVVGLQTSADAGSVQCTSGCGTVTYSEYQPWGPGDSKGYVWNSADVEATWSDKSQGGDFLTETYDAANGTYAWDIREIQNGYSWNGNKWVLEYKGRFGCPKPACGSSSPQLIIP